MNTQAFDMGKAAYQRGDWAGAVSALNGAKAASESCGEADHLRGNALMKLGMFAEAAAAYGEALSDASYGHVGALNCNRGRALVAAGQADAAEACFQAAVADPTYPTPYKAHVALGKLYESRGQALEAGTAWRNAAIDESNPDPSGALLNLGGCFMTLGRPDDAVEAYRTALDFSVEGGQGAIYAELGRAYMASNRLTEAVDSFNKAAADPSYQLTADQQVAYTAAQRGLAARQGNGPSETDQLLDAAGYGANSLAANDGFGPTTASYDPLDPMGRSGEFIPSPEDTGFFSVTEEDLMAADKDKRQARRKHSHRGLKVFLTILIILIVLAGAGGFAFWRGYGWPTQEAVVSDMFSAASQGNDIAPYLADSVSSEQSSEISALLPAGATSTVSGVDRSTGSSTALVTANLPSGGSQSYQVTLVRSGLGWKVSGVELSFASQGASSSTTTGTLSNSTTDQTDAAATASPDTEAATADASTEAN